jgi:anaphase-promoting complex subunit 3
MVDVVRRFLDTYQYNNALSVASILYAEEASAFRLSVLADVHIRRHEYGAARTLLVGSTTSQNRFMHAVCCLHLGELQEAEDALVGPETPLGASALHLLGMVCQRSNRVDQAITYYRQSLAMDPFMFNSFTALCDLGVADAPIPKAPALSASAQTAGTMPPPQSQQPRHRNPLKLQPEPTAPMTAGGKGVPSAAAPAAVVVVAPNPPPPTAPSSCSSPMVPSPSPSPMATAQHSWRPTEFNWGTPSGTR